MERQGKRATQWAFGTVQPATSPRLAGSVVARPAGGVPRADWALDALRAGVGQPGRGRVLRGLDGGASAGWEARAASAVGAAMVRWLGTVAFERTEKG